MEAVAAGLVAWRQAHNRGINDLVAVQQHQPVHGPDKFGPVGTPAHALGNGKAGQGLFDQFRHQFYGWLALLYRAVNHPGTLVGFQSIELVRGYAEGGRKARERPGWIAGIVEGRLDSRPALFHRFVWLGIRQVADTDGETTGRGKGLDLAERDSRFLQTPGNTLGEGIRQWLEGLGGQFFSAQFDQKILCCHDYAFPCSCCAFFAFLPFLLFALSSAASAAARTSLRKASGASGKPSERRLSK